MDDLSNTVIDFAIAEGACAAGIATVETLAGGPPSADLSYIRSDAKSAISFAVPLDEDLIISFLKKESRLPLERNVVQANSIASGISLALANFLELKGISSTAIPANLRYRPEMPNGLFDLVPDISHRYLAVRSGIGHFGLSGNLITPNKGAAVILGSVVTTAELVATDPLPAEQNYCDRCGMCMASCASGFVDLREKVSVTLGGIEFSYAKRRDYFRCGYLCGGFTGLHPSGQWSTWSPGRFRIPENDGEFLEATVDAIKQWRQWPEIEGGFYNPLQPWKTRMACAHCQLVCVPDKEERKRRYEMITNAGVVVQNPDGSLESVSPQEADDRLSSMSQNNRVLYESP
jgi:epoxyqueuosine reductase